MLFEKLVSELRESFVRNRFDEDQYFGNPNIEEWLADQRKSEAPDVEQWNHCFSSHDRMMLFAHETPVRFLREYAEPSRTIPQSTSTREEFEEQMAHRAKLRPILEGFNWDDFEVYYPHVHSPIVVWRGECEAGPEAFYFQLSHDANRKPTTEITYGVPSPMVMDAIFATWWRGTPKAVAARWFLCELLAQVIVRVRAEAEAEFDNAVAVSADGKKILPADLVIVIPGDGERKGPAYLYRDVKVFRDNKILRHDSKPKHNCLGSRVFSDEELILETTLFWSKLCSMWHGRQLGPTWLGYVWGYTTDGTGRSLHLLIAPRHLCPDPLPEGGEEILGLII